MTMNYENAGGLQVKKEKPKKRKRDLRESDEDAVSVAEAAVDLPEGADSVTPADVAEALDALKTEAEPLKEVEAGVLVAEDGIAVDPEAKIVLDENLKDGETEGGFQGRDALESMLDGVLGKDGEKVLVSQKDFSEDKEEPLVVDMSEPEGEKKESETSTVEEEKVETAEIPTTLKEKIVDEAQPKVEASRPAFEQIPQMKVVECLRLAREDHPDSKRIRDLLRTFEIRALYEKEIGSIERVDLVNILPQHAGAFLNLNDDDTRLVNGVVEKFKDGRLKEEKEKETVKKSESKQKHPDKSQQKQQQRPQQKLPPKKVQKSSPKPQSQVKKVETSKDKGKFQSFFDQFANWLRGK